MSFTPEVNKMWSRDAFTAETATGLRTSASIIEGYQILAPPDYTKIEVSDIAGVPPRGTPYPGLPDVRLTQRNYQRLSPIYWLATVTYKGEFPLMGSKPEIEWSDVTSKEAIDEDFDGNPIATVNGEPIDGVSVDVADTVLSVRRNFRSFSPSLTSDYRHSVNSDEYLGFPAGTGRMVGYSAKQMWDENDTGYWDVHAKIQFRKPYRTTAEKAWYARVRHEGHYEKIGSRIVRAVDANKEPVVRPIALKDDGTRETDPEIAHWREFQLYEPLPYNALGLI